ncbi:MAG TPA: hypothetical protein VGL46_20950 [Pseudonocardiaceae bacterium]|jgi:hypothetical protein
MYEALSSAEMNRQHAEPLPARTVLSLLSTTKGGSKGTSSGSTPFTLVNIPIFPNQTNTSSNG